jgi:hypothetical protein
MSVAFVFRGTALRRQKGEKAKGREGKRERRQKGEKAKGREGKRERRQKGTFYFTWVLDLLISVDATNIESITRWVCLPCPKSGQWPQ